MNESHATCAAAPCSLGCSHWDEQGFSTTGIQLPALALLFYSASPWLAQGSATVGPQHSLSQCKHSGKTWGFWLMKRMPCPMVIYLGGWGCIAMQCPPPCLEMGMGSPALLGFPSSGASCLPCLPWEGVSKEEPVLKWP